MNVLSQWYLTVLQRTSHGSPFSSSLSGPDGYCIMVFWKQPVEEKISESLPPVSRHDVLCIPVSKTKVTGKVLGCHLSFGAIVSLHQNGFWCFCCRWDKSSLQPRDLNVVYLNVVFINVNMFRGERRSPHFKNDLYQVLIITLSIRDLRHKMSPSQGFTDNGLYIIIHHVFNRLFAS